MRRVWIRLVTLLGLLFTTCVPAASLIDIQVNNSAAQASVTLTFDGQPKYAYASQKNPARVVIDVRQSGAVVQGLPLTFREQNLVSRIASGKPKDNNSIQLIFDLKQNATVKASSSKHGNQHRVVFTLQAEKAARTTATESSATVVATRQAAPAKSANGNIVIAIDAGHGGKDSGAVGINGLQEKTVTLSIARKLKSLLDNDPAFQGVLTRDGDHFVSVLGRSDVARNKSAHLLVSIHADAAPNRNATGASVWVLSTSRANSELGRWLEQHEKQSELLGGAGDALGHSEVNPYLSQAVLDLQFGHSQRVGYDVAVQVLSELKRIGSLHKAEPEHASLGVLRSPDIPSLLIETGFISNRDEERLLGSAEHQQKLAQAIYHGIRRYFALNPPEIAAPVPKTPVSSEKMLTYVVKRGDTLSQIAVSHGVSVKTLIDVNALKKEGVWVGQRLKIPQKAP